MRKSISNGALASALRVEGSWLVEASSSQVRLTKKYGRKYPKVVSFMLERQSTGYYNLQPITYEFQSKVSHFDYTDNEKRWARDKKYFKGIFDLLKATNTLGYIQNANSFIKVNPIHKGSNKEMLKNQLTFFKSKKKMVAG